jgi:ectoine hydroxylase-related dioxygenase (phytanoyl-CoA dioxygenase family)
MTVEQAQRYPAHVHGLSPALTLQGAVAHCDMPVESGPTLYLPYSQLFEAGYLAFSLPEFVEFFRDSHVQLPLRKGDAVFFNPALYHGAGHNRSHAIRRSANLLQISSPFGRAMEVLDREAMANAVYPTLLALQSAGASERTLRNAVVATAECYPFPTNLDQDQPVHSLAPATQVDTVWEALRENADPAVLAERLAAQTTRRQP